MSSLRHSLEAELASSGRPSKKKKKKKVRFTMADILREELEKVGVGTTTTMEGGRTVLTVKGKSKKRKSKK